MKIIHRVGFPEKDAESRALLASMGIRLKNQPLIATFEIDESDSQWSPIEAWIRRRKPSDIVWTEFTRGEITAAEWLTLQAWHHGYPQPDEDHFGYREATYDLSGWCSDCGTGMRQVAPFQMKGEPRWGRNSLLQLIWVYEEIFVRPELWQEVFQPHGVAKRPVLAQDGGELSTVVQLVADEVVPLVTDGLAAEQCGSCGRLKYLPVTRGFFAPLAAKPSANIAKTVQYFGSGGSAFRQVLVSAEIVKGLMTAKARGVTLTPLALHPEPGSPEGQHH